MKALCNFPGIIIILFFPFSFRDLTFLTGVSLFCLPSVPVIPGQLVAKSVRGPSSRRHPAWVQSAV